MNDLQKEWVAALRSGEYEQGKIHLRSSDGKYCCLGVLCDVIHKREGTDWVWNDRTQSWECERDSCFTGTLSIGLAEKAGLLAGDGPIKQLTPENLKYGCLWKMNDNLEWTFDQIADFIEQNESLIFVQEEE